MILQNDTDFMDSLTILTIPEWIFACFIVVITIILFIVWLIIIAIIAAVITGYLEEKKIVNYSDTLGLVCLIMFLEGLISFFLIICIAILFVNPNPFGMILYQKIVPCMLLP